MTRKEQAKLDRKCVKCFVNPQALLSLVCEECLAKQRKHGNMSRHKTLVKDRQVYADFIAHGGRKSRRNP